MVVIQVTVQPGQRPLALAARFVGQITLVGAHVNFGDHAPSGTRIMVRVPFAGNAVLDANANQLNQIVLPAAPGYVPFPLPLGWSVINGVLDVDATLQEGSASRHRSRRLQGGNALPPRCVSKPWQHRYSQQALLRQRQLLWRVPFFRTRTTSLTQTPPRARSMIWTRTMTTFLIRLTSTDRIADSLAVS